MLNPFKKKDDEFKLDDISLPTMGENEFKLGESSNQNLSNDNSFNASSMNNNNSDFQNQNSFNESQSFNTTNNDLSAQSNFSNNPTGTSFDTQNQTPIQTIQPQTELNSVNNDITKAKLESMEAKINLVDVRLSSIEQKLELMNRLILEEVSENTKRKLNVDNMMDKIRNFQ